MKSLFKIYLTLSSGILLTALVLVTVVKLTNRNPLAPTAPTQQQAAETAIDQTEPINVTLTADQVGLTVQFQGIQSDIYPTILARVQITADTNNQFDLENVAFQRGSDGLYRAAIAAPQPPDVYFNTPVTILIKGEKHVQRRFNASIAFGQFTDLTSKTLKAGDLPIPGQDGRVDQTDIDYIKANIFTSNLAADLNYDGIVNAGDLSLILDTLGTKVDEE